LCRFSFQNIIFLVKHLNYTLLTITFLLLVGCQILRPAPPDAAHPSNVYIENKGSDTLVNLALAWAEYYQTIRPEIRISVTGGGSGTGIAALINGTVDLANSSRHISRVETETARARGIEPVEHVISQDAIAVIVHHQNPISELSLQQISDIYSGRYNNWSELGGQDRPIVRLSRETNSGTHIYFLEEVMRLGDPNNRTLFSQDTLLLPSAEGIMEEVRHNPNAIGYDGLGYITPDVKMIAVAREEGGPYVLPSAETVNEDTYPIARDLFMYTAGEPVGVVAEFLEFIFSEEAQMIAVELGFVPLRAP
jgi:phosphate transport system substrate-binding protein